MSVPRRLMVLAALLITTAWLVSCGRATAPAPSTSGASRLTASLAKTLEAFASAPVDWDLEPAGDVSDGTLHVDVVAVDATAGVLTIDATQLYVGDDATAQAMRLQQTPPANGYEFEYNAHAHRQVVSIDPSAAFVMRANGSEPSATLPASSGGLYVTDAKGFMSRYRAPGADYWVVLDRGRLVCLVERASS